MLQDFTTPLNGFFLKSVQRHNGVDEAHVEGFLRVVLAAEVPDLTSLFLTDKAGHVACSPAPVKGAYFRPCLTENSVFSRNGQVTEHMQNVAPADRVTGNHGDNRFRAGADVALEVEHVESVDPFFVRVSGVAPDFLIAARAESQRALSCQDNDADVLVIPCVFEGLNHFNDRLRTESVAPLGTIDGYFGYAISFMVENIGEITGLYPVYSTHDAVFYC